MNICVYGASSNIIDEIYIKEGETLGEEMVRHGHSLVFGGGANGVMGAVARGVTRGGGKILGVAPKFFNVDGVLYEKCDEMLRPNTMRERKQIMEDSSDAFITAAGGIGTFEEFFEILTLKQLGRHNKPIVVLNTNGYYDKMEEFIENSIKGNFVKEKCKLLFYFTDSVSDALSYIENYDEKKLDISSLKNI